MKFVFKKITIDNFLSFGHAEIDLAERGYTLITGINNNPKDAAKSNGSGKSTIFSALCFALTGETIQGLSSNLNNIFTDGDMSVDLVFSVDADDYEIIRSRNKEGHADLKILINGDDKSGKGVRESEAVLADKLPDLTSDLVGEVILIGQGMPHKFSSYKASGRKDLLEKLSHSDFMIEDVRARVDNRVSFLKEKKETNTLEKTRDETELNMLKESFEKKSQELEALKSVKSFDDQLNSIESTLADNEVKLSTATKTLEEEKKLLEIKHKEADEVEKKLHKELDEELQAFNDANLFVKREITEKQTSIALLTVEIKKLQSIKDVCPTCHQKLPHVHKQDTSEQENRRKILIEDLEILKTKDAEQTAKHNTYVEQIKNSNTNKLYNTIITNISNNIYTYNNNCNSIRDFVNNLRIQKATILQQKENHKSNIKKYETELLTLTQKQTQLEEHLLYLSKEGADIDDRLNVVNKMSILIKRDFRGLLLSNIINYIDSKCKSYAQDIFGHSDLDFVLSGNNINISFQKKPLEALSGGEQQKVDLITQFAIRSMMEEFTGFHSNILVLDEILDNLDTKGCDAILDFITKNLCDIESVFIISHHADSLNIGNDSMITVIKNEEGVSSVL